MAPYISACLAAAFAFACANTTSSSDKKEPGRGEASRDSDEGDATPPVSVAGAFLACAPLEQGMGCRVEDAQGRKVDESRASLRWGYMNQSKTRVGVAVERLPPHHRYHARFSLMQGVWGDYVLAVSVTDGTGASLQGLLSLARVTGERKPLTPVVSAAQTPGTRHDATDPTTIAPSGDANDPLHDIARTLPASWHQDDALWEAMRRLLADVTPSVGPNEETGEEAAR